MATQGYFKDLNSFKEINRNQLRTTIESAFYGNNVTPITSLTDAYNMARKTPGAVELTGMPVYNGEKLGLPADANVLLFNDGAVFGRCAAARRIEGRVGVDTQSYATILREAIYNSRFRNFYSAESVIGLDEDFMVKAHIMVPENFEISIYNWLLNFQFINDEYKKRYKESKEMNHEGDIFVFVDPEWSHPDFPLGLAFFSPEQNCAAILGMRYFGELKKGTLTLAWGIAGRNGYASCHGGLKRYTMKDGSDRKFVLGVFGLSGSGKSTITHAKHGGKYDVMVLHDDAFIINAKDKYAIALEPSYFDKMNDYPMGCEDNKYLLSLQNCGVTRLEDGRTVVVSEDMRNGNGRAIKSKFWSPNRVDRIDEPLNAICWLMKDPTLPPVLKVNGASLASVMGATLATKRTSAERLAPGVDPNALVIESYANPFRTYPLGHDYEKFRQLFADGVDCYILNTGAFMGHKIPKELTLSIIEKIAEGTAEFKPFGKIDGFEMMECEGFEVDFSNEEYRKTFVDRMSDRLKFVQSRETFEAGIDKLPESAAEVLSDIISKTRI